MKKRNTPPFIVKPLVPEQVYTDRDEFINYFYDAALSAAGRRTMSTLLLGQRRMGKTEIFKRVVNRLFFEQDPNAPDAVVPVYYSFPESPTDNKHFAMEYLENFLRFYVGYYTMNPELIIQKPTGDALFSRIESSRSLFPFSKTLDIVLSWYEEIEKKRTVYPQRDALEAPRIITDVEEDLTICVFLDELQNARLPQHDFDVVGFMQQAVESPACPHFVTGSAMTILSREIIGRGSLFGRFWGKEIYPMTEYWGAEYWPYVLPITTKQKCLR
jgi:hypothetical protein